MEDLNYHYTPRPMDVVRPINRHEFRTLFYEEPFRTCAPHAFLQKLPKRTSAFDEESETNEKFWGLYAREALAFNRVLFYSFAFTILPILAVSGVLSTKFFQDGWLILMISTTALSTLMGFMMIR